MAMTLLTTNTESGDATSSFTSSIDSTYKLYIFKIYDANPATDTQELVWQGSIDGGSNYNVAITSTAFESYHGEDDSGETVVYTTGGDLAQGTGFQRFLRDVGNGADESGVGELFLFNPSNTTYVKHFYSRSNAYRDDNQTWETDIGGYLNTTSAVNAVQFKFESGNMDAVIKMYGVG